MVIKHHIQGYEKFCEFVDNLKSDEKHVHIYFSGSKMANGISWCSDCAKALPIIESKLASANANSHFVYVEVGDREYWKNRNCPFRTDKRIKLMVIPTLVRWKYPQKLEGDKCENPELVEMLLTDEE